MIVEYSKKFVVESIILFFIIFIFLYRNFTELFILFIVFICALTITYFLQSSALKHNNVLYTMMDGEDYVIHKNIGISTIFENILPYIEYNPESFKEALLSTSDLIKIHETLQLDYQYKKHTIDIVEELKRNILNNLQSLFHSFPSSVEYEYQQNIDILSTELQKIINDIKSIYKNNYKKYGPDIYNSPPDVNLGEWSNPLREKNYNKHWNFYY